MPPQPKRSLFPSFEMPPSELMLEPPYLTGLDLLKVRKPRPPTQYPGSRQVA